MRICMFSYISNWVIRIQPKLAIIRVTRKLRHVCSLVVVRSHRLIAIIVLWLFCFICFCFVLSSKTYSSKKHSWLCAPVRLAFTNVYLKMLSISIEYRVCVCVLFVLCTLFPLELDFQLKVSFKGEVFSNKKHSFCCCYFWYCIRRKWLFSGHIIIKKTKWRVRIG